MTARPLPSHREALATCVFALVTAAACAALMSAAALLPAPPAALPLLVMVCVGCPMLAGWQAAAALPVLRLRRPRRRLDERALVELRRELDRLPETAHPLDR
jgi:hypothetical protein